MTWRRWVILGITVFLTLVVVFSLVPYTWHGPLRVPTGVKGEDGTVRCAALWAPNHPHSPLPYPPASTPCGTRTTDQVLTGVDVLLGVAGLVFVGGSARRRHDVEDDQPLGPVPA